MSDGDEVRDSWIIEQELMRRNAAPSDPAAIQVDDLIRFLDQALRLAAFAPAPRPTGDFTRALL